MKIQINFGVGEEYIGDDFLISSSSDSKEFEYLLFFDSRGSQVADLKGSSFSRKLADYFCEKNKTFLLVNRPKVCTTFFTLCNLLFLNDIKFRHLITNVGFVDLTPKKPEIVNDIILQKNLIFRDLETKTDFFEYHKIETGETVKLSSLDMLSYHDYISHFLANYFESIYLLGTVEFSFEHVFPRVRPRSFYNQLKVTNLLLNKMKNSDNKFDVIMPPKLFANHLEYSVDGVHFVSKVHDEWFEKIISSIGLNG